MNGIVFEGKLHQRIVFRGVDLCRAREAAGLSQGGLARRLKKAGIQRIGRWSVSQQRIGDLESEESFAVEVPVFSVIKAILERGL